MSRTFGTGDTMPDIAMAMADGGSVRLSDYKGQMVAVFFYPRDNTPGCTMEAMDFTALKGEFDKAGVAILGVSKDSPRKHQSFIARHDLAIALASDAEEGGVSDALGIWTMKQNYGRSYMGMVRTTYLIGADGRILQIWNKVKVKGHAREVLEAARALQAIQ